MINHFPTFPLVLDYGARLLKTWTPDDEDGLLFALQHLSRANEIMLSAPQSTLTGMAAVMVEAAPRLERLELHSQSAEFVLPKSFLGGDAPQLRRLILAGVSLATLHPLLRSATSLVSLVLERIHSTAYFSPDRLVMHIRSMPCLKTLSIGFLSATPRPGFRAEPFLPPGQTVPVELPALTQLIFRGVSAYIEALLAQIRTPLIQDVDIMLFNQLTLRIPRTRAFIHDLESFRPTHVRIDFAQTSAYIIVSAPQPSESPDISLGVSCVSLDFQVSALSQISRGLFGTSPSVAALRLPVVEELMLGFHPGELPKGRLDEDIVNPALWRALLSSFQHVRTLRVHATLVADLSRELQSANGTAVVGEDSEPEQLLLPNLRTVVLLHGDDEGVFATASEALNALAGGRSRVGRSINVEPRDLNKLSWPSLPARLSSLLPGTKNTRRISTRKR